jgi:hypothetical protein
LRYCHNYYFGKWSTCSEGGLPLFPSPHLMTSEYSYHQRWILDFNGHYHCKLDSHRYDGMNTDDNNTCNNDGCLGEDMIICWMNTKQWLHSLYCWDIWVFSLSFWFIFYRLCLNHYCVWSWSSLVLLMLVSDYRQWFVALQCA